MVNLAGESFLRQLQKGPARCMDCITLHYRDSVPYRTVLRRDPYMRRGAQTIPTRSCRISRAGPTVSTSASTSGHECMVSLAIAKYLSNASPSSCNCFSCVSVNHHAGYILFSSRSHLLQSLITASLPFTPCGRLSPGVAQSRSQERPLSHLRDSGRKASSVIRRNGLDLVIVDARAISQIRWK